MANSKPLSQKSTEALLALKGATEPTLMSDLGIEGINSAHLTALVNRGLVEAEKVTVEVPTTVKRKVNAYALTEKGREYKGE